MSCVAFYLRVCPLDLWFHIILAVCMAVICTFWARSASRIPPPGWVGTAILRTVFIVGLAFSVDWFWGYRQQGRFADRLTRCAAGHQADQREACGFVTERVPR